MKKIILFVSILVISFIVTFAHEYILIAEKYSLEKGDTLEMHLFVADGFNIEFERQMQSAVTKKFELINENGTVDLLSSTPDGAFPIVKEKVDFEGLGLVHLERKGAKISMNTTKFLEYLKEDNIENITVSKDQAKKMQRESYTRYIKALVQSGKIKNDTLFKMVTGQKFEITLLQNPYKLHKGDILKAQVFFNSMPLTNKVITARNRIGNKPSIEIKSRTDSKGICNFKIPREGNWFIHATHMMPSENKTEADWESFWASYSFGIN